METRHTDILPLIGRKAELKTFSEIVDSVKDERGLALLISGEPGIGKTRLVTEFLDISEEQDFNILSGSGDINSPNPFHLFSGALKDVMEKPLFEEEEHTSFSEIFAVDNSGLLLAATVDESDEEMDGDIFAGMLSAVQNFVKDSFDHSGDSGGGLGRLEYGNMKILIEHGAHIYLAAVIKGKEHPEMKQALAKTVRDIDMEDAEMLESWSGDMDEMQGIQSKITTLSNNKYLVRKEIEDLDLENERRRIADRILELLYGLSEDTPILLLLEDLQWADESSLFVFDYISRNVNNKKILTMCTRRPKENEIADKAIDGLKEDGNLEEMMLSRLSSEEVGELMDVLFVPNEFPEELGVRLSKECEGNPFFVIEMLKQMEQEGNIGKKEDIYKLMTDTYSIPTSVEEVVYRRLELLDPDSLTLIEYASCEGGEIDARIPEWFDRNTEHEYSMQSLMDSGILVSMDEHYSFSHAIFRDVIYNSLSRWWKNSYHHILGEFYEYNYKDRLPEVYYDLARHFSNTNDHGKAFDYSFKAGEKAEISLAPEQAINFYENSLYALNNIRVKEDKTENRCELFVRIGDMRGLLGDFDESLEYYNKGLELANTDEVKAALHRKLGHVFMTTGDYERSIEECDIGLDLLETEDPEVVKLNRVKGRTYMRTGDYDDAMELLNQAFEIAVQNGDDEEIAEISHNQGTVEWYRGEYDKALEHLEYSLELRKKMNDPRGKARAATNIGIVYYSRGDMKKALEYYEESLGAFKKIGDKLNLASVYGNMGMAYFKLGELDRAAEFFEICLELFERVGDKGSIATSLNNLGLVQQDMGDTDKALEYHKHSLRIREDIGDKQGTAMSLHNIGKVYSDIDEMDKTINHMTQALDISMEIEEQYLSAEILCSISETYIIMEDTENALKSAKQALKISVDIESDILEGQSRRTLGGVYRETKRWDSAQQEFDKAKSILEKGDEKKELASLFYEYGVLWKAMGEVDKAKKYLKKALEIQEELNLKKDMDLTRNMIVSIG